MSYAEHTSVPQERSEAEIKRLIMRYGANRYMSGEGPGKAVLGFEAQGRRIRFELPLPSANDKDLRRTSTGRVRRGNSALDAYDQEVRRRWRCLALVIKAKLESVATGVTTFEDEFLAHIVMPDGKTVAQHVGPAIETAYATGQVRGLLPEFS
jgi:hypothetical protein